MAGIIYLIFFLGGGLLIARYWLPQLRPVARWYIGASVGLFLLYWLPVLWAYPITFSVTAHLMAALTLALIVMLAYLTRDRRARVAFGEEDRRILRTVLLLAVPLTLLAGWLEYTHSIRPDAAGGYSVGQSTYGDLSLHLAITTSIVNAPFPLQNSLMVGATMAYPYLADAFAATLYLLGLSLPAAMAVTGTVMCAFVFVGYALLCARLCRRRGAVWLAVCLLFINGGLGFFYTLSGTVDNGVVTTVWDHLKTVMEGYYQTPTNQPDPNNLRWVNILCDMLVPQRGILGGWTMLLPVLNLVLPPLALRRRHAMRGMIIAGVIAGGMPLLHTHSFLALALCSLGFCIYAMVSAPRGQRMEAFKPFLVYGAIAATLSQSQLVDFTFVQAANSDHFLRFQFNWCNNRSGKGLIDPYFWFYIKNIGLPYLLILLALFQRRTGALRDEAERAAAQREGLYMPEPPNPAPQTNVAQEPLAEAPQAAQSAPEAPADIQNGVPDSNPGAGPNAAPVAGESETEAGEPPAPGDTLAPERFSVFAHDMPAYGQTRMYDGPATSLQQPTMNLPFVRPLAPDQLHASAYSPDDSDRVGVMRAVTGESQAEQSHRPLLEELFHATVRAGHPGEGSETHRDLVPGLPETCFANEPPARDWVRQNRLIALGAFLILLVAEFILFQPNEYDNNKLIYVWFLLCLPMAADYALELFARLRGLGGRRVLAALVLIACFLSGGLTIAREAVSDYPAYSQADRTVAAFVRQNTPEHSVFLTGNQHLNAVASLAGRTIVCGSDLYLYYHGFNTAERKQEVQAFYESPADHLSLLQTYQVQYIYLSPSEWYNYNVDGDTLRKLFPTLYESEDGSYLILTVPETYRAAGTAGVVQPAATQDPALNPASAG